MDVKTQTSNIKAALATKLRATMKRSKISQSELARRMQTSRAVIHRLLNPSDPSVTLTTIARAATALGCEVRISTTRAAA